jgi:hypothetical protein
MMHYSPLSKSFLNMATQKKLKSTPDLDRLYQQRIAVLAGPDIGCGVHHQGKML